MGARFHCGACGRPLVKVGNVSVHVIEEWDQDYVSHDAELVRNAA